MDPDVHTLFLWRNSPTVVIGKHQNPFKECHLQKMEQDGVLLVRRKSGGGAVFQDLGNSCFTFLSSRRDYDVKRNMNIICNALKTFGVNAEPTGRNDITVDNKKISGSAFKLAADRAFHHGTLLINVDKDGMEKYLNPNKAKLKSKGVESVRARVLNLQEVNPQINHESLTAAIIQSFFATYQSSCTPEYLDKAKLETIDSLKRYFNEYQDWNWRYGQTPDFEHNLETRFDWGIMDVHFQSSGGKITAVKIFSDTLYPQLVDECQKALTGAPYSSSGILTALEKAKKALAGTNAEPLVNEFGQWLANNI